MPQVSPSIRETFAFVCHEHRDMLLRFARRLTSEAEAEDLVQHTIASYLERYVDKPPPRSPEHWLITALVNRFRTTCRKDDVRQRAQTDPNLPYVGGPQPVPGPEPAELTRSVYEEVTPEAFEAAIQRLGPKLQQAYRLHMQDLSNDRIAKALGILPGTVAKRLHDARKRLKRHLLSKKEARP
jgi:RNA polymerase sigma-70 factor (ECF subfamily)